MTDYEMKMSDHFPALCECHQEEFGVCICGETLNFDGLCPNSGPPERKILEDLIAELRMLVDQAEGTGWPDDEVFFADSSLVSNAADRAEARLKELNND